LDYTSLSINSTAFSTCALLSLALLDDNFIAYLGMAVFDLDQTLVIASSIEDQPAYLPLYSQI